MTVARTQPASHYLPDRGDHLREVRFLRTQWVMLAHDGALPEPGDNFALDILGCPILLRRERDGSLTAFLNACPHRGGPLAWPGQSNTRLLQCRYHGWTFRGDGALIEPVGFGRERRDIQCAARTLHPLRIECRDGLILACLNHDPGNAPPALPDEMTARLAGAKLVGTEIFPAECNWKLYAENWLEAYHIQSLHRSLSDDIQAETYRVDCGPFWAEHSATPDKGTYGGYWAFLYPTTAINFFGDGFSIEQIAPLTETTCAVQYQFYQFTDTGRENGIDAEIALTRTVTAEDIAAAEHVQKSLAAGIFERGFVSKDREPGILAFHDFLRRRAAKVMR